MSCYNVTDMICYNVTGGMGMQNMGKGIVCVYIDKYPLMFWYKKWVGGI
jgi:hypothetical protein